MKFAHLAHLEIEIDFVEILAAVAVVAAAAAAENDVVAVANSLVVGVQ